MPDAARRAAVLAQPPEDVLHFDDRVVHDLADPMARPPSVIVLSVTPTRRAR